MFKKILIPFLVCMSTSQLANAGLHAITIHSRANCGGFNESITWHAGVYHWLETYSRHVPPPGVSFVHDNYTGKEYTWRSAAYHYAEAWPGDHWLVYGKHLISYNSGRSWTVLGYTDASDCSIYDGWWG